MWASGVGSECSLFIRIMPWTQFPHGKNERRDEFSEGKAAEATKSPVLSLGPELMLFLFILIITVVFILVGIFF